ncbi:class I SAM-dependent methyltransferase [Aestuariibacter halophilus]|uniref:Class I SAM-dependent methyltransferase n=1 Tax=Fluctibacter halophilus TaxID=226011 RepID=A0ABS8G9W8_9ALTE|nr:class I SAM-dependent methyltransferase [Aestuariibacter halophilus]MCC2616911.1 class I SAM-dependent methyltransferase [Aestuariibacter halophilus]
MLSCPLCLAAHCTPYHQDARRRYFQCQTCALVFVDPQQRPSSDQERQEYNLHQNHADDPGYIRFLERVIHPIEARCPSPASGIDFGCGPGPVLATQLRQRGYEMTIYDPFYFPDRTPLSQTYDLITCTEAIEHFHQPAKEWQMFTALLNPGGWLAIMTKRVIDPQRFATWHYKNDPTHVSFFSEQTFRWLALNHHMHCEFFGPDVVLMQNKSEN